jgi:hypothetical protein
MRNSGVDQGSPSCPVEYYVAIVREKTGAFTMVNLERSDLSARYNGEYVCAKKFRE